MTTPPSPILSTSAKALQLNLDQTIYGTFAEIGAGQETANCFFRVSGAAGLVAKTISAYDMTMSDSIYGQGARYVSRQRLMAMLDHENRLLIERLAPKRGESTTFFSFCNTVKAKGWKDTSECHGWFGLRFQRKPGRPPSDVVLHVRMLDDTHTEQMEALGILGVNLIHSTFYHRDCLKSFVESLTDNLSAGRIEVDMLSFGGDGYEMFDNRLCALQLVESGLTDATMFLPSGEVVQPSEVLYKRPVLLLRGSFDPVMKLHLQMLEQATEGFEHKLDPEDVGNEIELCEITLNNLLRQSSIDPMDFIDRADALQALGKNVLVSRCPEFHRIAAFLSRQTSKPIGLILSIGLLNELFKPKWSENLGGGVLESFGRLFKNGLSLLVFPWRSRKTGELVSAETFRAPEKSTHLYQHFMENGMILPIPLPADESLMRCTSRDVASMLEAGGDEWKNYIPEEVHAIALREAHDMSGICKNLRTPDEDREGV